MRLGDWLSEKNETPTEFAKRIGRAYSTVNRLLRGETIPDPITEAVIRGATDDQVTGADFYETKREALAAAEQQEPAA